MQALTHLIGAIIFMLMAVYRNQTEVTERAKECFLNPIINETRHAKDIMKSKSNSIQPELNETERQTTKAGEEEHGNPFHSIEIKPRDLAAFIRACKEGNFIGTITPVVPDIPSINEFKKPDLDRQENAVNE